MEGFVVDQQALQVGQTFADRYRVEKFLAKGGFGAVYIAEQIETELRVALKVLWPHVLHSHDAVEKFRLEARVAGRVGSDHIVKVFDAGFDSASQMPFLVMELLRGAELDKIVETEGPLAPARVAGYFRQIASGLDRAHGYITREGQRTPIVHRDLKPENLFLAERESGEPVIKILDFGIAKVVSESTQVSQEVKGTPLYMAFEQVAAGKITPQTDIWPLGLIAFYLLTGKVYWKAANHGEGTVTQLFGEVLSLPIELASQRAAQLGVAHLLPPAFDAWFARCVEREPAKRFASAGECAQALADVLGAATTQVSGRPPLSVGVANAVTAQTLGRTTGAPLVSGASLPTKSGGGLKWLAIVLVALAAAALAAVRSLRPSPPTPESTSAAVTPPPSAITVSPSAAPLAPSATPPSIATDSAAPAVATAPIAPARNPSPVSAAGHAPPASTRTSKSEKAATAPASPGVATPPATAKKPTDLYGDR